jgi:hypothetical protein
MHCECGWSSKASFTLWRHEYLTSHTTKKSSVLVWWPHIMCNRQHRGEAKDCKLKSFLDLQTENNEVPLGGFCPLAILELLRTVTEVVTVGSCWPLERQRPTRVFLSFLRFYLLVPWDWFLESVHFGNHRIQESDNISIGLQMSEGQVYRKTDICSFM